MRRLAGSTTFHGRQDNFVLLSRKDCRFFITKEARSPIKPIELTAYRAREAGQQRGRLVLVTGAGRQVAMLWSIKP